MPKRFSRRPGLLLIGVLGAALLAACSSDESGGRTVGEGSDAAVDGSTTGSGGSRGAGGGTNGGGAGSGAGGGSSGGASARDGGADAADSGLAGPACTPLASIPSPVTSQGDVKAACPAPTACGGPIDGTEWAYSDVCLDQSSVFAAAYGQCPTAHHNGVSGFTVTGTLSFSGGKVTNKMTATGTGVFQMPAECASCDCKGFQDLLIKQGTGANTYCYPDCYPDSSCRCLLDFAVTIDETDTYTASGSSITLGSGKTYAVCTSATDLTLTEPGSAATLSGSATLIPTTALVTPEICNGLDDDKNGQVDDSPIDCPTPCLSKGVCRNVKATCTAGAWACAYGKAYEATNETICDGLDNDCDGEVDEGLVGCVEICDGLDNDDDGTIDDSPTGSPCSATLGVCAGTFTGVCGGAKGWHCQSSAAAYQADESKCDGLDNDCDGQVDEGCSCATGKDAMFVAHWGTAPAVVRADLDGKNAAPIAGLTGFAVSGLAIDPKGERIYFYDGKKLRRSHLDGTVLEDVWTGDTQAWALDPSSGRIFVECGTTNICQSSTAAPGSTTTLLQPAGVAGMSLDAVNRQLYWSDYAGGYDHQILRVGLDGKGVVGVVKLQGAPLNLLVDPAGQKVYWPDALGIHQAGLDGSNPGMLVSIPQSYTYDMKVDTRGGKLYFTDVNANEARRVNLDGTGMEPLLTGVDYPVAVALYRCAP